MNIKLNIGGRDFYLANVDSKLVDKLLEMQPIEHCYSADVDYFPATRGYWHNFDISIAAKQPVSQETQEKIKLEVEEKRAAERTAAEAAKSEEAAA